MMPGYGLIIQLTECFYGTLFITAKDFEIRTHFMTGNPGAIAYKTT